ncbi:Gfo/Idh/MocA family protein [Pseudoduganella lutea]|uniref:Gfo/Idh/MocA family oxidoreductase n=1 Tax=Pseudoduganella lutea TaxID=321985 RepID=A0A4P6L2Z8_9BURK|nr:Gfo/Idh/MocA family oxidoreductase [Pseudoduganella lutea]QBE66006.1 Gfo/Idh/MocA family oxidoreductase [Pseudoduganella lutea]
MSIIKTQAGTTALPRKLRLGMVGGGDGAFIGAVHRIAARLDDCYEVVAGALSSNPERALASGTALRFDPSRCYADYREMARAEAARIDGIDAVAIVTPNHLHAPVATAFLEAGIHVICDKPLGIATAEGEMLAALAREKNRVFALTHTYTGYPLVRHARELVASGAIGDVRLVHVEYAQDWMAEAGPQSEAFQRTNWHNDPERAGPTGCTSDIGTHAFHLAGFVSGMQPNELLAELHSFTPNRVLDDHVQMMLRYPNGARGMLWSSQMATGCENALKLRVFGTKASLAFDQENPNELWLTPQGGSAERLTRGRVRGAAAEHATRVPSGHPEGYLEAFAQLYRDAAARIHAVNAGLPVPAETAGLPTVDDGVAGMRFIDAVLESDREGSRWVALRM